MKRRLLLAAIALSACGKAASSGLALPPCGPSSAATPVDFQPTHVEAGSFGSGPEPSPAPSNPPPQGFQITATAPGAQMTVRLFDYYPQQVEALCVTSTSGQLGGSLDTSNQQHSPVQALIAIDSVQDGDEVHGRVVSAWFTDSAGQLSVVRDVHFSGLNLPVP